MRRLLVAALFVVAWSTSGCSSTSKLSIVTGKNVDLTNLQLNEAGRRGKGSGKSCQDVVIAFPTSGPPSVEDAVDRAVEGRNGDVLVNATIGYYTYYIPYIYGQTCWTAVGEVYDSRR